MDGEGIYGQGKSIPYMMVQVVMRTPPQLAITITKSTLTKPPYI